MCARIRLSLICVQLFCNYLANAVNVDYATFPDQRKLVKDEGIVVALLKEYVRDVQDHLVILRSYLSNYYDVVASVPSEGNPSILGSESTGIDELAQGPANQLLADYTVKDPILSLHIMKRFSDELPRVEEAINSLIEADKKVIDVIENEKTRYKFPDDDDVDALEDVLLHVALTYNLTYSDLLRGDLGGVQTGIGLSPEQIFELAKFALTKSTYTVAINLLGHLKLSYGKELTVGHRRKLPIDALLEEAIAQHDAAVEMPTPPRTVPNKFVHPQKIHKFKAEHLQWPMSYRRVPPETEDPLFQIMLESDYDFAPVCQTGHNLTIWAKAGLKCFLSTKTHPFWILGPQKIEILSKDPFVIQIHDFLTPAQVRQMKQYRENEVSRSMVVEENGELLKDSSRISCTAAIPADRLSKRWNKLIEMASGLAAVEENEGEPIQITSYGAGGHFSTHLDAFYIKPEAQKQHHGDKGERIVTVIIYLQSVEAGGKTAFPKLQIAGEPVAGSALMWYNTHPNGTIDFRTLHAGCPILYGSKWIATKWIRSNAQALRMKCAPQHNWEKERFWLYDSYGFPH